MYKYKKATKNKLKVDKAYIGESIEQKIQRIVNNKEPITDGAPLVYTDRSEGVNPAHDIRTDRFEVAIDAMDKVAKTHQAKREERLGDKAKKNMEKEKKTEKSSDGGAESTGATDGPKA